MPTWYLNSILRPYHSMINNPTVPILWLDSAIPSILTAPVKSKGFQFELNRHIDKHKCLFVIGNIQKPTRGLNGIKTVCTINIVEHLSEIITSDKKH